MRKKVITTLLFIVISIYAIVTLVNQQIILNRYSNEQAKLNEQIEEETTHNDELVATKSNVNSKEFIEQMAREKLDMYLPTEKVYIDAGI